MDNNQLGFKMMETLLGRFDSMSHVPEILKQLQGDFVVVKQSLDTLQKEMSEMRHKENNMIARMQKDFLLKEGARPLIREIFDDHGVVREKELWGYFKEYTAKMESEKLDKVSKKSATLQSIMQVVQILFPVLVVLLLVLGVGTGVYEAYK